MKNALENVLKHPDSVVLETGEGRMKKKDVLMIWWKRRGNTKNL